jgi:multidrug resistance efflux pump
LADADNRVASKTHSRDRSGVDREHQQVRYDLKHPYLATVFKAPTDGYVTQVFLCPDMMAVPLPLRPVMVFAHAEDQRLVAAFQQNAVQRINAGDPAEIAFDAIPGVYAILPLCWKTL